MGVSTEMIVLRFLKDQKQQAKRRVGSARSKSQENDLARSGFLKFSAEVWGTIKMMVRSTKQSLKQQKEIFSMLDMEMCWSPKGILQFREHLKEKQTEK
jgi:hypothetical protein